jgi:hypothetical protein
VIDRVQLLKLEYQLLRVRISAVESCSISCQELEDQLLIDGVSAAES